MSVPQPAASNIAVYIDLENVAIGVREAKLRTFEVGLVLDRLVEKGNIVVRKAYADWGRYEEYKRKLHEAGVELIDLPGSKMTGKNSADIKMVVDSLELAFSKSHIDTFALVTGDSDFYPLVAKLRENNKHTIAVGVKNSTSTLLIDTCDEFIFYDDLVRKPRRKRKARVSEIPTKKHEAFVLLVDASLALLRENKQLHSSLVKETMKRKQPQFNEEYHGYRSFSRLLEDAEKYKIVTIRRDDRSGTYVIDDVTDDAL
jgi:uncharacterized protein (TIGR00288 family)